MTSVGLYYPGNSVIHRLNPITKLTLALAFTLTAFIAPNIWIPLVLFLVSAMMLQQAGMLAKVLGMIGKFILFMLLILLVVQSFWYSGGASPVWIVGPLKIKVYGFFYALLVALRLLTVLCSFYLFIFTTHPSDLVANLEGRGLSPKIGYVVLSTLQAIPEMQERANSIMEAQQCRGVEMGGSILRRAQAYLPLIGPLISGSVLNIESRALALEVRGFSAVQKRTILREIHEAKWERWARYALLCLPALEMVARIKWQR